MKGKVFPVLH